MNGKFRGEKHGALRFSNHRGLRGIFLYRRISDTCQNKKESRRCQSENAQKSYYFEKTDAYHTSASAFTGGVSSGCRVCRGIVSAAQAVSLGRKKRTRRCYRNRILLCDFVCRIAYCFVKVYQNLHFYIFFSKVLLFIGGFSFCGKQIFFFEERADKCCSRFRIRYLYDSYVPIRQRDKHFMT